MEIQNSTGNETPAEDHTEAGSPGAFTEAEQKFCSTLLQRIKRTPNAGPFLKPVDPVALGIPDYFDKIKHPMDLSTIKSKLDSRQYSSIEEFNSDFALMFNNCYTYNHPESAVYGICKDLQKTYEALYEGRGNAPSKRQNEPIRGDMSPLVKTKRTLRSPETSMSLEDFTFCSEILSELEKTKHRKFSWPFLFPVTEQDAPGYFTIISSPMDLSTVRSKLDGRRYSCTQDFINDVYLIVDNCFKYNQPESEVFKCGVEFKKLINILCSGTGGSSNKGVRDLEYRINDIRKKISALTQELQQLEQQSSKVVFSLTDRERIGRFIIQMNKSQLENVAKIVHRHCAYEYVDNDEIEINLQTMKDDVVGEIDLYIQKIKNGEGDNVESDSDD